jgi:nitrogen fixation NifU-like protein
MSDLEELYQEIVMEHNRQPRNFREPAGANRSANGFNPFCGDMVTLFLKVDDDTIADVGFQGSGCAISKASASMLTESVKGVSEEEAERTFKAFRGMVTRAPGEDYDADTLGDLEILGGVAAYPVRIKCATLSWHTLHAALAKEEAPARTE